MSDAWQPRSRFSLANSMWHGVQPNQRRLSMPAALECQHSLCGKRLKLAQALLKNLDINWFWAPLVRLLDESLTSTILILDYQTLVMHSRDFSQILKQQCECIVEASRCIERNFWKNTSRDIIETVTVAGLYDLRRHRSSAAGGFAHGPSSRLTVALISP